MSRLKHKVSGTVGALLLFLAICLSPLPAAAQEPALDRLYVVENGQAVGPLPAAEVEARLADGRLRKETLLWRKGMTDWTMAGSVGELAQ